METTSVDLNIVQRGLTGNDWTQERGPITSAQLDSVGEQKVNNGAALNSLPTPFARFFVVGEAYRRVLAQKRNPQKSSGLAYERLVSDSLDVFEILYYLKYYNNQWAGNRKIVIKEWNFSEDLNDLKNKVHILGDAIGNYYKSDLGNSMDTLFFVVMQENGHEYLLGTSSPMTGFITPPDLDKHDFVVDGVKKTEIVGSAYKYMSPIKRKGKGYYFIDVCLFEERPADFKNFLYHLFAKGAVNDKYIHFQNYIQEFSNDTDINLNWRPEVEPILSENKNPIVVNGISFESETGIKAINFLSDKIVKLPYRINSERFVSMKYNVQGKRNYDFLLPFTKEAFNHIDFKNFSCECQERNKYIVITLYNGTNVLQTKKYVEEAPGSGEGIIYDLAAEKANLSLALFPNILSPEDVENNYFKLLVSTSDDSAEKFNFTIDDISCTFFKNGQEILIDNLGTYNLGIKPCVVRTKQMQGGSDCSTKYYEVFNTVFDAISVEIQDGHNSIIECGIVPKWTISTKTNKSMTYAVDLGTSNTYISCRETGQTLQPQQLTIDDPVVSILQEPINNSQLPHIMRVEDSLPKSIRAAYKTEFVPALIDGDKYRFPIRTALCKPNNMENNKTKLSLFDNTNIAFFYEKMMPNGDQYIETDVKWADDNENLRLFIRELLLIIKCDILKANCNLSDTNIVWFRPLSFRGAALQNFKSVWEEEATEILNLGNASVQIQCYTESEAPYYYFKKENTIKTTESVAIVDIGGGSTDIVYFDNGSPKLANSVHFGCDVLWGNGFNAFDDARGNGIYQRYQNVIKFKNPELEALNESLKKSTLGTNDIIGFWISNDKETGISRKLREDFKPYFLYHFTSIIYYMASMFKSAGLNCPRVITFSGNGSRYIDDYLTADPVLRKELVMDILKSVYPEVEKEVQLVLPQVRKECTCYGGLYRDAKAESPRQYFYLGYGNKEYDSVKSLAADFEAKLYPGVTNEIKKLNKLYLELLGKMSRANEFSKVSTKWINSEIDNDIEDTLRSQFQMQILEKYNEEEVFNDTLFFLPVVDILYNMSNNLLQAE